MKKIQTILFFVSLLIGLGTSHEALAQTATTSTSTRHDASLVEAEVRKVFADAPAMIEIARCESKFRQFTDSGNPLRGGAGGGMIGVFQFFESVHSSAARSLGFDLATLGGNLGYARHVYDTQGTSPWNAARSCWETAAASASVATPLKTTSSTQPASRAELEKRVALLTQLITLLQTMLELKQKTA